MTTVDGKDPVLKTCRSCSLCKDLLTIEIEGNIILVSQCSLLGPRRFEVGCGHYQTKPQTVYRNHYFGDKKYNDIHDTDRCIKCGLMFGDARTLFHPCGDVGDE